MPQRLSYSPEPDVAAAARLIGDPARAAMLLAVAGGNELNASDLASRAAVSPQAASAHLAQLTANGFLVARSAGRQRLFRVSSTDVAHCLEALAAIAKPVRVRALGQDTALRRLRDARSCYDHLAGRLGVALADRLLERDALDLRGKEFALTSSGETLFETLGIDLRRARAQRRAFSPACMDWTEKRQHLAGSLGAVLLQLFITKRWLTRIPGDRALRLTEEGRRQFQRRFRIAS